MTGGRAPVRVGLAELWQGHALDVLRALPAESVHCCITSPPFYGLRNYGTEPQVWGGDPACAHEWGEATRTPWANAVPGPAARQGGANPGKNGDGRRNEAKWTGPFCRLCGAWRGELGQEPTPELYVQHLVEVFREVRRLLRRDGTLFCNIGDAYASGGGGNYGNGKSVRSQGGQQLTNVRNRPSWLSAASLKPKDLIGVPWMLAFALRADGWYLRQENIWAKRAPMPESITDRTTRATESVFHFAKSERYFYDAEAIAEPSEMKPQARLTPRGSHPKGDNGRPAHSRPEGGAEYATRNRRNFWLLGPEAFPDAHFAVMPTELAAICIKAGTSEKGCCPSCGAPWARVRSEAGEINNRGTLRSVSSQRVRQGANGAFVTGRHRVYETTGWRPTCACDAGPPVPCAVLDPFAGAGTTLLVADRLQRHGIGIELSPSYAEMARRRLERDAPLIAAAEAGTGDREQAQPALPLGDVA